MDIDMSLDHCNPNRALVEDSSEESEEEDGEEDGEEEDGEEEEFIDRVNGNYDSDSSFENEFHEGNKQRGYDMPPSESSSGEEEVEEVEEVSKHEEEIIPKPTASSEQLSDQVEDLKLGT